MTIKRAPQGMVGIGFDHKTIANAKLGEMVTITGDMEVDSIAGKPIGVIAAIDKNQERVTVECFCSQSVEAVAGAAVTAGKRVKYSAQNTVVEVDETTLADVVLACGICINGGLKDATVTILPIL